MFDNCPGCVYKTATCGTRGPVDSPFVIVGESPGRNEIKEGKPFVGDSGQMLKKVIIDIFKEVGAPIIEPFITNAVSCFPQGKNIQNLAKACHSCSGRLVAEIKAHPRKVILALGNGAAWSLTNDYNIKVTQMRGQVIKSPLAEHGVVVTVHPAFLLRGGGSYPKFKEDIATAIGFLVGKARPKFVMSSHYVFKHAREIATYHRELSAIAKRRGKAIPLAADIETSGFSFVDDDILSIGLGHTKEFTYIIPERLVLTPETKALMEDMDRNFRFIWHNGKFDVRFLRGKGMKGARVDEDTMLLSYCLDETRGIHDLEQVSADACGAPNWKAMLTEHLKSKASSYRMIPTHILHKYLGLDIGATLQSWLVLRPKLDKDAHLSRLYPFLCSKSNFLVEVELNGLFVDKAQVKSLYTRFKQEISDRKEALNVVARARLGKEINPNSPMQMAELLYDGVRLPMIKGSRSTDADTLDMLPANPVVAKVKEYRRSAKIYSTYVKCLYDFDLDPQGKPGDNLHSDGYIHSTYLLHGSVTGRLASRNINVQNIPREADIRSQFVVKEGRRYIELDLNQAELRCLAELSRCPDLGAIYLDEKHPGLHHEMSVFLFGEGYTDEDKMRTKAVNFGIVYGRTAPSLAEEFKTPVDEAQRWIDGWFKRFPGAAKFITSCRNAPLEGRILITPFGRKRRFGVVSWENKTAVQNEASNFPHQSIASDCNLEAAERIYNTFAKDYDARPCNLVHDSNLWDMPDDDNICAEFGYRVIQTMESVPKEYGLTTIPFKADGKMGYRWGHLNKVKASFWKMRTLAAA